MRWLTPLCFISSIFMSFPVLAQLSQIGPSGDFRVNDRPGTVPTVGAPGGPSLPPSPTLFGDFTGARSPEEILKNIDKDLGSRKSLSAEPSSSDRPLDLDKDLRPGYERPFQ